MIFLENHGILCFFCGFLSKECLILYCNFPHAMLTGGGDASAVVKFIYSLILVMAFALPTLCYAGTGLVRVDARTAPVVLYDDFFHSCHVSLLLGLDRLNVYTYAIALTLDEGDIYIKQGDRLVFTFRDRTTMELHSADRIRRNDITTRQYQNDVIHLITVYYHLSDDQLARLLDEDIVKITIETSSGHIVRNVKNVKNVINELFNKLSIN